jgi:O-antigen/teichoic acid export membrane protein
LFYLAFGLVFSWAGPLWPAYADAAARGEGEWVVRQHRRSLWQCVGMMAAAALALALVGRPLIRVWAGADAVPPQSLLWVMAAYFPVWTWSWVNGNLFQALGGMKLRSRVMLLNAAVNLCLSILLVRRFGPVGVSLGSLFAMGCTEAVIVPLLLRRRLRELAREAPAPGTATPGAVTPEAVTPAIAAPGL